MANENSHRISLEKLLKFSEINDKFRQAFRIVQENSKLKEEQKCENLLNYIALEMLILPQYFEVIYKWFPEEFPKLLLILISEDNIVIGKQKQILKFILLAKVVKYRIDLQLYALQYFEVNQAIFELIEEKKSPKYCKLESVIVSDLDIVESCYFLLKSNPDFYRNKWKWSIFIQQYLRHADIKIRWVCCQVISILFGFHGRRLNQLISNLMNDSEAIHFNCNFDKNLTLIENKPTLALIEQSPFHLSYLSSFDRIVSISGIYLPVSSKGSNLNKTIVEVPSTYNNLRKIALGLSSNRAICLQGAVGSGKTSLLEYLAKKTGRILGESFVKVQLGDQTDSKMLLGTYRCTDIPGEFIWQPGVLTQAVLEGSWLVLEDIDSASMDIASVLTNLLENKYLTVPGYRDSVPITPGFQLFVTQRLISTITGYHKRHSNAMTLLEKHLLQIKVDPLTPEELKTIVTTNYREFITIADRLINVFQLFCRSSHDKLQHPLPANVRQISTRDFFKWCSRAVVDFDIKSQESALKVLQDAIDVFCCSSANFEESLELAKQISTHLGIINQKAEYFLNNYKPSMKLTSDSLVAGRVKLPRTNNEFTKSINFSFTRLSAVLLERIMCCIQLKEPILLVGETGTGKTSCVQYLANTLGQKLVVINMNQQSDSADLLGGFKPVDLKFIISPIRKEFEEVFSEYFKVEPNRRYLSNIALCFNNERWSDLVKLMNKSCQAAVARLENSIENFKTISNPSGSEINKLQKDKIFLNRWKNIERKLQKLELQLKNKNALAFSFIEGSLVKAVKKGYWVLLDEINLANAETLECLSGLLEGSQSSLCLLERGDKKPVERHSNFTLFACMNPSTDVGKKDLPAGLRNRFTEFFVDELNEKTDLMLLVKNYLEAMSLKNKELENIVNFYLKVKESANTILTDGLGHKPQFSLRSLCRALIIASTNPCGMFKRSLYEAFCLSFLTQLDNNSYQQVEHLITSYLIGDLKSKKAILQQPIPKPISNKYEYLQFEGYWVKQGVFEPIIPDDYILTQSVRKNLKDLVRIVSIGKLPVLLQGDTSVGKTSLITYLAKSSGNKCVRINNHEHTDIQEYIGSYVADSEGKLVFREGLLVEAMRKGHWIILDELNLAPTDVLEALNRVLDDNRELFIPETQDTVKADPNFMLFATQNPPGVYGGRKMLSRAFRNRFVELHFNEIPPKELEYILHQRCQMSSSYAKKMINVMKDLQIRRKGSAAFAGKHGFITLRDLFRWGERYRLAKNINTLYDWDQHLADEGYLVLAGRVRQTDEKNQIIEVLQKHLKRDVIPTNLFTLSHKTSPVTRHILEKLEVNKHRNKNIVWTYNLRQLAVLTSKALEFKEPVLLVGDTGGGKTTVCQLIAENNGQQLLTVNCHMHTESSDFIGSLRPVRDHSADSKKLFEWVDGPIIQAMIEGHMFLADEISLADDSVLERLNSLLEPERFLLLAEKGTDLNSQNNSELVVAHTTFSFIGTMNPGGDYGKKELSPALRNRFTEIWCESCKDRQDLVAIIEQNLQRDIKLFKLNEGTSDIANKIMDFVDWFELTEIGKRLTITIRDILTWVNFINVCHEKGISIEEAYIHGVTLTFLDSLGSGVTSTESLEYLKSFKMTCVQFLNNQLGELVSNVSVNLVAKVIENKFGIDPFYIDILENNFSHSNFYFDAPSTLWNTRQLLRGMQLNKAILLEGSPGVGKTSLVMALAKCTGQKVFRVNLSDQTDISDLFGADLPIEEGMEGQFSWKDGPLLQALIKGSWILLDELNLASQSVLEGLNACLDHRGEIFIPELGRTFHVKPGTRFFACQNPVKEGGSRRGLPKSFLNRFIQVFIHSFEVTDLFLILKNQFPMIPESIIQRMIEFNTNISNELNNHTFGHKGAPWECNLRDLTRWCEATMYHFNLFSSMDKNYCPENIVNIIYSDRMRTSKDKQLVHNIFNNAFDYCARKTDPLAYVTEQNVYIGEMVVEKGFWGVNSHVLNQDKTCLVLKSQLDVLRSLLYCIKLNWMAILVGNSGSGKSSVVKTLSQLMGKTLKTLPVTSVMDTTDLLGGFEQTDYGRHLDEIARETEKLSFESLQELLIEGETREKTVVKLLMQWEAYRDVKGVANTTMEEEVKLFLKKTTKLKEILNTLQSLPRQTTGIIKNLQDKLLKISTAVETDGSLNAGGKFEWVDSILVKCLQEGSWLLIDNVNLCSSAVLDRLNALLEPNGFLTISERGVDQHGEMVEIKPHSDFRLFLTMDPKNGEISRAMRNRGIEICLLNDVNQKCIDESNPTFDVMSLIHLEGIKDCKHITSILKIHDCICEMILGEKPQLNDLLLAASLISQQLNYGVNLREAFCSTFIEVYYKTRHYSEFNCNDIKTVIEHRVEEILRSELDTTIEGSHLIFSKNINLKTQSLEYNPTLEKVKQQAVVLQQFMTTVRSDVLETWNYFINFFSLSSYEDLNTRNIYINNCLENVNYQTIIQTLYQELLDFEKINDCCKTLPLDLNWVPQITNNKNTNKFNLTLHIKKFNTIKSATMNMTKISKKSVTLLEYMKEVEEKKLQISSDNVLIILYRKLNNEYMKYLDLIAKKITNISDDMLINILLSIFWDMLFFNTTLVNIKNMSEIQQRDIHLNLIIHYRWFYKYSLKTLSEQTEVTITDNLKKIVDLINEKLEKDFSYFRKICRVYQKNLPLHQALFTNKEQLATVKISSKIINRYDISNRKNDQLMILSVFKQIPDLRTLLTKIIYSINKGEDITEPIKKLETILESETIRNVCMLKTFELTIIPFLDIFTHMQLKNASSENVDMLSKNILLPVEISGDLTEHYSERRPLKSYYLYMLNSPSTRPNKYLRRSPEDSEILLNSFTPKITYILCNIISSDNLRNNTTITLGNYRELVKQYAFINNCLWTNVHQLAEEDYDYIHFEKQHLKAVLRKFNKVMMKTLGIENNEERSLESTLTLIIDKLNNNIKDQNLSDPNKKFNSLISNLQLCYFNLGILKNSVNFNELLLAISELYTITGYVKATLNSELPLIDPLIKKDKKNICILKSIESLKMMQNIFVLQNQCFSNNFNTIHPYFEIISNKINELENYRQKLNQNVSVRPDDVHYNKILGIIKHAFNSIIADVMETISQLNFLINSILNALQSTDDVDIKYFKSRLAQYESYIVSCENILHEWSNTGWGFPDIINPLLENLTEFLNGYQLKVSLLKKLIVEYQFKEVGVDINNLLLNMVKFPVLDEKQSSYKNYFIHNLSCVEKIIEHIDDDAIQVQQTQIRLLKCSIYECFNMCLIDANSSDVLNKNLYSEFINLVEIFLTIWNKQKEKEEMKQKEAESLYKTRVKHSDKSEDEQMEEEFTELFPNYHNIDFKDFQKNSDLSDDSEKKQSEITYQIPYEDLKFIVDLHFILMKNYTKTEWLNPVKDKNIRHDFIKPLLEKYKVFNHLLEKVIDGLDYKMDNKLIGSISVLLSVTQRCGNVNDLVDQPSSPSKMLIKDTSDFYKDSNVEEVKSCYHILEELKIKITEFLKEWPEQPTLQSILQVIDRIYNFDINSPISRFLTGLEILLSKCYEWEQVAHSGVTLGQFYKNLIDQIIAWRKLELSMWKDLLNRTYNRLNESIPKWWQYLYNIMQQFIIERSFDGKELIKTLETFIAKSNLAEFQGRLELLYIFHCHATYLKRSKESKIFVCVLWNLYSYFQQFELSVSNKIKDLRSPIEKKLKDYVKIVRWKDVNYWSVKETVDKSHKTLHKFIREFQDILLQPVLPYLTNTTSKNSNENIGIWDRPQRQTHKTYHYSLDVDSYIAKQSLVKKIQSVELNLEKSILGKMEMYFLKSRTLCKKIILATEYPILIQSLDRFLSDVIETSIHLQNLEVDSTLSQEKQKSQAKNILQQKHRALADLFKSLNNIGLSFKSGLINNKLKNSSEDYVIKPIDLTASFSHISHSTAEEKILTIWESCEVYYVRSLMRMNVLETTLINSAKDLGLQNIDRCKGFSADLLSLMQKQKMSLIKSSRTYYYLCCYLQQISEICEGKEFLHISVLDNIKELLKNITIVMNQYKIILNSCPNDNLSNNKFEDWEMPILDSQLNDQLSCKATTSWSKAINCINHILNLSQKLNIYFSKCQEEFPSFEYDLATPDFIPINDISIMKNNLDDISRKISELKNIFGNIPLAESISWLESEIKKINLDDCGQAKGIDEEKFKKESEKLVEKILVVTQHLYQKYLSTTSTTEKLETEEEVTNQIRDEHLTKFLIDNLSSDLTLLEMKKTLNIIHKLVQLLVPASRNTIEILKPVVHQFLPILEQFIQLQQFFMTQQVAVYRVTCKMTSILLNIFIELSSKGFCIPPEFSEELDSEGINKPSDGLGLGEGQGERDVSDKIESEDQLEEAQPADQEQEQKESDDCKEEDKGIEMSEDFDSKLQDIENKADDDDEDRSGDSDADEQMGETEKGANQLNEEIWGSDKEEELDEKEAENKEEKGDEGKKQGDEEITAKDENSTEKTEEHKEPNDSKDKEKNKKDINEFEEPEYDDDQIDPHHGKQPEMPEPEPMDLPDDLQLDEGQEHEDQETVETNPFDIDTMMEQNISEETRENENEENKETDEQQHDEVKDFSDEESNLNDVNDTSETEDLDNDKDSKKEDKLKESIDEEKNEIDQSEIEESEGAALDQSESHQDNIEAMDIDDKTATDKARDSQSTNLKSSEPIEEICQEDKPDKEGLGQSQMEESKTGHSAQTNIPQKVRSSKREIEEDSMKNQKPGESDSQRSLGDIDQPVKKKLKTMEATPNTEDTKSENDENESSEIYQHIKDAKEDHTQVLDVATEEQVEAQKKEIPSKNEEENEPTESTDVLMEQENDQLEVRDDTTVIEKEKLEKQIDKNKKKQHPEGDILEEVKDVDIEGDVITTSTVQRATDSTYYTQYDKILETSAPRLSMEEINSVRLEVEKQLSTWNEPPSTTEAEQAWQRISSMTSTLAQDLSEQLRLILEPTQASRLKGDFRTGKRINMRKVIPYIASQFRKDKIWLRRTKPSKREYQIVIAIDDSSSMADNNAKELAFESVSLLSKALTLLESGKLSVVSFGENIEIVHKLTDQFTNNSGVKLLQKFQFSQNKTYVAKMVDFITEMLNQSHSTVFNAKLLIIVSDGVGVFSEGESTIELAVRRAKLSNIFMIFVIVDSPEKKHSILDMRKPVFDGNQLLHMYNYMDCFPFPFYIILRDINSLPNVLSDALRQWFEVVSNLDK